MPQSSPLPRYPLCWLLWFIVIVVDLAPLSGAAVPSSVALIVVGWPEQSSETCWPWWPRWVWRAHVVQQLHAWRRARRLARWWACWQWLRGVWVLAQAARHWTMAEWVDLLTRHQIAKHLGSLPILYATLEELGVREIISQHCPTQAEVDYGTVVLVLVLNRLTAPKPLYRIADWMAETVLCDKFEIAATKFNDDRLGRALTALQPHLRDIWLDVMNRARERYHLDLSVIFYDLTALIVAGEYTDSRYADYGFAHNTPSENKKVKTGANVTQDGGVLWDYALWSGRTADTATVQTNVQRLVETLQRAGWPLAQMLLVSDRACLNDELALGYDQNGIRYLGGLQPQHREHRALLTQPGEKALRAHPLGEGYFGVMYPITFTFKGHRVTHRVLVIFNQASANAHRRARAKGLHALRVELGELGGKLNLPRHRNPATIEKKARAILKRSPYGHLMIVQVGGQLDAVWMHYRLNAEAVQADMRQDGRYLLVTNVPTLTPVEMLRLYKGRDAVEKRFEVAKNDLKMRPFYVHLDARLEAMVFVNMLALLTYTLIERRCRQRGLTKMTARQVIATFAPLQVVETHCWDGSVSRRMTPLTDAQECLLRRLGYQDDLVAAQMPRQLAEPLFLPSPGHAPRNVPLLRLEGVA